MGSADDATDRAQIRSPTCLYKYLYSRALRDHFSLNCCSVIVFLSWIWKNGIFLRQIFSILSTINLHWDYVWSHKKFGLNRFSQGRTQGGVRGEERRSREKGERKEKKREGVGRTEGMQRHHEPRKNYLKASTFAE